MEKSNERERHEVNVCKTKAFVMAFEWYILTLPNFGALYVEKRLEGTS